MKVHDGLRLILQFYANNGALRRVEECTGVKKEILERFLDGKRELTPKERQKLEAL